MEKKAMNMFIPSDLHRKMKVRALLQGKSCTQYIIDLIEEDLKKEEVATR